MSLKKAPEATVTKTGATVTTCYCRKCMEDKPHTDFYDAVDNGLVDSNGKFSVCKDCINKLYDILFEATQSMEKSLHKLCISLNIKYSNEAASATKTHIQSLLDNGKKVNAVFGIFKSKLVATNPSMDKSATQDLTYSDVGTIFTTESIDVKEIAIPTEVREFWGKDVPGEDIEYLETQYANFKKTHAADSYAQIVLLKRVCYTMLDIEKMRAANDDSSKLVKELMELMKNLAISPNAVNATGNTGNEEEEKCIGLWTRDVERYEPCQWLKDNPKQDLYYDVGNVEQYFQDYIVRPMKNFITQSKDFSINNEEGLDDDLPLSEDSSDTSFDKDEKTEDN